MNFILVGIPVFIVAVTMTMVGKGGGNFYVVILTLSAIPIHEAATTGQFILFCASVAAMMIFQKKRSISWKLAITIGSLTALSALLGGYFSHQFSGFTLKLVFAAMLVLAGIVMLIRIPGNRTAVSGSSSVTMTIKSAGVVYRINLFIAFPVTVLTGFVAGMVGVSGGSFLVPLMVLACGVPMHIAVGTVSPLIAATALMGFAGHAANGDFVPGIAIPLAVLAIIGGILGGKFALKTKSKHLKTIFAYTNWIAAMFMIVNAIHTNSNA